MEEVTEYTLRFKEGTDMDKAYDGEFISENKEETDKLFEQFQEQVELYFEKVWKKAIRNEFWEEKDVWIIYDINDETKG